MEIYNGRVVQCTGCRELELFSIDDVDIHIKGMLNAKGWIFDEYYNQFCTKACQITYQRECEHDREYIIKTDMSTVCKNCGKGRIR